MEPINQFEKEKRVQSFLELYKQQMERYRQTQEIEWKANFGLWTLLAGAIYLLKDRFASLSSHLAWIALVFLVVLHGWWLYKIHKSEEVDKELWSHYRAEALKLLRGSENPLDHETYRQRGFVSEILWLLLEVGVTLLLALLFLFQAKLT
jgi:hypothetical protein